MKKILTSSVILLFSISSFSEMQEIEVGPKNKRPVEEAAQLEEENPVDMTQENNKRFYQGLYNKVQKSHPDWSKEEVLKHIQPLWYKKLEMDKQNVNKRRPSLSNELDIKKKKD